MTWLTVLYVALLAGAFVGCPAFVRVMALRHRDPERGDVGPTRDDREVL